MTDMISSKRSRPTLKTCSKWQYSFWRLAKEVFEQPIRPLVSYQHQLRFRVYRLTTTKDFRHVAIAMQACGFSVSGNCQIKENNRGELVDEITFEANDVQFESITYPSLKTMWRRELARRRYRKRKQQEKQ